MSDDSIAIDHCRTRGRRAAAALVPPHSTFFVQCRGQAGAGARAAGMLVRRPVLGRAPPFKVMATRMSGRPRRPDSPLLPRVIYFRTHERNFTGRSALHHTHSLPSLTQSGKGRNEEGSSSM